MYKIEESDKTDNESRGNTSNSDSPNEHGKRPKKRSTKKELYQMEREELIKEMNEIIGINENNQIFLYELERNEKIKDYLKKNMNKIRKSHKTGTWGYFSNDLSKGKDKEIGLLRTLYLDNDYNILSKLKINNFDNVKKQYTLLIFLKNINNN
jgi:hypothetical protein